MSVTYDLACPALKLKTWVGQRDYLYSSEGDVQKLARFLHATEGQPLVFVSEHQDSDELDACLYFEGLDTAPAAPQDERLKEFAAEVKQLCKDFSDLRDRPYMGDVTSAIDSLLARFLEADQP